MVAETVEAAAEMEAAMQAVEVEVGVEAVEPAAVVRAQMEPQEHAAASCARAPALAPAHPAPSRRNGLPFMAPRARRV